MIGLRRFFVRLSLGARLISSYLVILGIGGLAISAVGSWIVSSTIMAEAERTVRHDLGIAAAIYDHRLDAVRRTLALGAGGITLPRYIASGDTPAALTYLEKLRADGGLDFLTLVDAGGRVTARSTNPAAFGDNARGLPLVRAALAGATGASTELLPAARLARESPTLAARAAVRVMDGSHAQRGTAMVDSGLVILAAAPVRDAGGRVVGAIYGGTLLNGDQRIVDDVGGRLYSGSGEAERAAPAGSVTIFMRDLRIATNGGAGDGRRGIGTRASDEVRRVVLGEGRDWHGRAFVLNDRYITAFRPIRGSAGDVVGMLYVGLREGAYIATRNRVVLSFLVIASVGFILVIAVTYLLIRAIMRPIEKMVAATREIAAGNLDAVAEVPAETGGELAVLSNSFNSMLTSIRQMRHDLEEWGRTLELKVQQRSDELVRMQSRVAQSERLASIGMLAAGVAHEINNPLGGILALTALTLEDLPPDHPDREHLREVVRQTERCRDIVKHLLEFSRQTQPHATSADPNALIERTLSLLERQAIFFNVEVVRRFDSSLPRVMADESQLQQVVMNILVNAVQAMNERGTITVETRQNLDGDVEMIFSDTGRGIEPEHLGRIFDPFFTTKAAGKGTGLGLSIAYGIVTEHGGMIGVESEPGKGTTFTVTLPSAVPAIAESGA